MSRIEDILKKATEIREGRTAAPAPDPDAAADLAPSPAGSQQGDRVTVLLIADQERLHHLFSAAAPATLNLRIASSLAGGLQQVAAAPPDFLFVQNRLSGLSGEILVRHLKLELGERQATLVLFGEGAGGALKSSKLIDRYLDLGMADTKLWAEVQKILAASPLPGPTPATTTEAAAAVEQPAADTTLPADTVSLQGQALTPAPPAPSAGSREALQPLAPPRFQDELDLLLSQPPESDAPVDQPAPQTPNATDWAAATSAAGLFRTAPEKTSRRWPALAVLVLLAITAGYLLLGRVRPPSPTGAGPTAPPVRQLPAAAIPVPPTEPPAKPPVQSPAAPPVQSPATPAVARPTTPASAPVAAAPAAPTALPAFIPREKLDRQYGAAHPGWERYLTDSTDFRVFREGAAPKAVQIIDRSGRGLPPALFSTALRELAGVRDYRLVSKETNGEYLVKRGRLGSQAQVTLYKDRTDDLLHAFVVVLR